MSIKSDWEKRSKKYGTAIEGVLPKSFPRPVNDALDKWMYSCVKSLIFSKKEYKVLDLGCGYGRISEKILQDFPKSKTFGVDISQNYVEMYNENLKPRGKAVVSDIKKLPYKDNSFDLAVMITTLMYITSNKEQKIVLSEIYRVLKPGGKFIFIERNESGYKMVTLGGLLSKEITSVSFSPKLFKKLINNSGGNVIKMAGIPIWTLTLPLFLVIGKLFPHLAIKLLSTVAKLDEKLPFLLTPSFYIAYSGVKL